MTVAVSTTGAVFVPGIEVAERSSKVLSDRAVGDAAADVAAEADAAGDLESGRAVGGRVLPGGRLGRAVGPGAHADRRRVGARELRAHPDERARRCGEGRDPHFRADRGLGVGDDRAGLDEDPAAGGVAQDCAVLVGGVDAPDEAVNYIDPPTGTLSMAMRIGQVDVARRDGGEDGRAVTRAWAGRSCRRRH